MVDRTNAVKSVRSLSKTIDDLIHKEKNKISDHYQSKISQLSKSKLSSSYNQNPNEDFDASHNTGRSNRFTNKESEELSEALKLSTLTKTEGPYKLS